MPTVHAFWCFFVFFTSSVQLALLYNSCSYVVLVDDGHYLSKVDTVARSLHCIPDVDTAIAHRRRKSIPIYNVVIGKNNVTMNDWRKMFLQ